MNSITAESCALEQIFDDSSLFEIPYYQRPYAWSEEEAGVLLNDFLTHLGKQAAASVEPYFLGTIVVAKDHRDYVNVIDGQQRLTTLTILFAVLRKLLPDGKSNDLNERIYKRSRLPGHTSKPRLKLRDDSDIRFFDKFVQSEDGLGRLDVVSIEDLPESQQRITQVARYFLNQLGENPVNVAALSNLKEFVLRRCVVILVSAYDRDAAFTIFTVLNKRGLDLSAVDILKADILGDIQRGGKLSPEEMEAYAEPWEDLEQKLGRDGFSDLINYTRIIHHQGQPRAALIKEFRDDVIGNRQGLYRSEVIRDYLTPYGNALSDIRTAKFYHHGVDNEKIAEINHLFSWLNLIGNADWIPPAILFLSKNRGDIDRLLTFFKRLDRLAVYLMMGRKDADERASRYRAVTESIKGQSVLSNVSGLQLTADERGSFRDRLNGDVYNIPSATRKYILRRLNDALPAARITYEVDDQITIEHVLPQSLSPDWLRYKKGCWAGEDGERARKRYTHSIANLVLLTKTLNNKVRNSLFEVKRPLYLQDHDAVPFALTTHACGERDWSVTTVKTRQERLLGRLYELWDIAVLP